MGNCGLTHGHMLLLRNIDLGLYDSFAVCVGVILFTTISFGNLDFSYNRQVLSRGQRFAERKKDASKNVSLYCTGMFNYPPIVCLRDTELGSKRS